MVTVGFVLLALWVTWILGNLALMVLVRPPDAACYNGFKVYVPERYATILTPNELLAIHAHEHGHRYHGHIWKNFLLVCFFMRPSQATRIQQELEADTYAAHHVGAGFLATALCKVGAHHPIDRARVDRLVAMEVVHQARVQIAELNAALRELGLERDEQGQLKYTPNRHPREEHAK